MHGLAHGLPKALVVGVIAQVLRQLIPGDHLPPVTTYPRLSVRKVGLKVERGRSTFELANGDLVKRNGVIEQMAIESL